MAQIQSVQQDRTSFLSEHVIKNAGYTWRKRIFTPVVIIHCFIQQILDENTALKDVLLRANRSSGTVLIVRHAGVPGC